MIRVKNKTWARERLKIKHEFEKGVITIFLHSRELNLKLKPQAVGRVVKILNLTLESGEIS
jgi:hypothetical protein